MTPEPLGPAARALLDAARQGLSPDAPTVARIRTRVDASVAASAGSAITLKLGLLALAVAVVTGAVLYARHDRALAADPVPASEPAFTRESVVPALATAREVMPAQLDVRIATAAPSAPPIHRSPPHPAAHADLRREVELIDQAMAALRAGDTAAALAAVHTHAIETAGAGQLAEDAAAIEVEALCRAHADTAGAKLAGFDTRWPDSAQRSRLATFCH
jgi:hypothetical protein